MDNETPLLSNIVYFMDFIYIFKLEPIRVTSYFINLNKCFIVYFMDIITDSFQWLDE